MRLFKFFLLTLLVVGLLQGCTQQGECEGEIKIENPLPDITIQLDDGEHTINLSSPAVFRHTRDKPLSYFTQIIGGVNYLDSNIKEEGMNQYTLALTPREIGTARVLVEVGDGCLDDVRNQFTVTIE